MFNFAILTPAAHLRIATSFLLLAITSLLFDFSSSAAKPGALLSAATIQPGLPEAKTLPGESEQAVEKTMENTLLAKHSKPMGKHSFFALMKPIVISENVRIMKARQRLLQLKADEQLNPQELAWLEQTAKQYKVEFNGKLNSNFWLEMLTHVDTIPLEMALVQAANESAWGNSRFARQANNYFGQWCFSKGCGLVPLNRNPGSRHEVRRFDSPEQSVRSYMKNLNTSYAYAQFRQMRRNLRLQQSALDAELLANGLKSYSERGMDYVEIILSMIRSNRKLIQLA